jgi:predicted molibdopterin-dependent oxidoreductase YjgC
MPTITLNDRPYECEEGATVLEVARANGLSIPTLCYHPALRPSGSCKLCAVETTTKTGRRMTLLACILRVREGLAVRTEGELVEQARVKAFRHLLQLAPQSHRIREMAAAYNVAVGPEPDGCVRCRLCVRVCKQIVGADALIVQKRDGVSYVAPVEGRCIGCGTCVNICPTHVIRVEDRENVRTLSIRDEVIGRHPLERCEGCGRMFATPRFLDRLEARIGDHPHVKDPHNYCPNCAKLFSTRVKSFEDRKQLLPGHH